MPLSKRLAAECIGTFGFFLTGFMGIVALTTQGITAIQSVGIAVGFGFGLALMIFAFGHVSGGHFNPAVTLGLASARKHPVGEILPYWAAQIAGGLLAALLVLALYTPTMTVRRGRASLPHLRSASSSLLLRPSPGRSPAVHSTRPARWHRRLSPATSAASGSTCWRRCSGAPSAA